ncbi:MAG: insulinase family protein, partial [Actinobacteria bacterium]|nr:insulinase family protein [Actinomycetota bacterium]
MTAPAARGLHPTADVLPGGTRIVAAHSPTTPAVTISAALHAGSLYDPSDRPGVAHFLSRVLDRGTAQRSGEVIAESLDLRGVSLRINVTRHALM